MHGCKAPQEGKCFRDSNTSFHLKLERQLLPVTTPFCFVLKLFPQPWYSLLVNIYSPLIWRQQPQFQISWRNPQDLFQIICPMFQKCSHQMHSFLPSYPGSGYPSTRKAFHSSHPSKSEVNFKAQSRYHFSPCHAFYCYNGLPSLFSELLTTYENLDPLLPPHVSYILVSPSQLNAYIYFFRNCVLR